MTVHQQRREVEFPIREELEDAAGKVRAFVISCHDTGLGFTVRAVEDGVKEEGYVFAAFSETSPYSALGRLRQKMRWALATRHITTSPSGVNMLHDTLVGRITWNEGDGVRLVVDGKVLSLSDLEAILASHEGWGFELRIVSEYE